MHMTQNTNTKNKFMDKCDVPLFICHENNITRRKLNRIHSKIDRKFDIASRMTNTN